MERSELLQYCRRHLRRMRDGEEVCLCIIPKEGYPGSTAGLRELLGRKLAPFKVPRYILVFKSFPEKNTGKVDTVKLREEAIRRLGL